MSRDTSRDYAHPYRPLPIRLVNRVGQWVGRASLDPDSLIRAARKAEGLHDLGDPPLEPMLARMLASVEAEAALSPMGRWITRIRLVDGIRARLRLQELWTKNPEILETELPPIVAIVGLQRTGTTLLQRLLSAAPGARSIPSWEAMNPVPFATGADPDTRINKTRTGARALRWLTPDFFAVHPVDPLAPEEEVILLDLTQYSTVAEATMRVPSWSRWLEEQDQTPGYHHLRRVLQTLIWQRPGTHLILKTPHHLEWLSTLLATFPEARVVMTHRDPLQTQASFCSMVAHSRGLTSDEVDPVEIGAEWLRKCGRMVERALVDRDRADPSLFLDVGYDDLLADPVQTVARVHAHVGLDWSEAHAAAVKEEVERRPKHGFGRHVYELADFGLSEDQVRATYAGYCVRFGLGPP